jgi:hypothetical protein
MKNYQPLYIALIIVIISSSFIILSNEFTSLKISFRITLNISASKGINTGSGYFDSNSISYEADQMPFFNKDAYNIELVRSFQQDSGSANAVIFNVMIKMNDIQKVLTIEEFKEAGSYSGPVYFNFDWLKSGTYKMEIRLLVNGSEDSLISRVITVY